ncbi:Nup53/35/40-type RNA recognition motif-domain-containing protein [Lipomyces kononenkoae]|uniref:Nup53/35/40-type RNA recognition motif-domain-containing protein n=1 Tax=Lipomyces kononenkoae TaxID=34357 RepID=A0ACC3TBL3_LIPKO
MMPQQASFGSGFGTASQTGGGSSLFSSPFTQQQQGTPSQFSSSFGPTQTGGLTHSQSAFDLGGQQQQQLPGQFMPQQQGQQNQIPSTNAFLLTSPPRAPPPAPAWAAGAGESRRYVPSHLTHMRYKNSPIGGGGGGGANGYYTPDRMPASPIGGTPSPAAGGLGGPLSSSSSRSTRPFPSSQSTTALRPSSESSSALRSSRGGGGAKFGGPSFGVPKPHHTRSSLAQGSSANVSFGEFDDLPPTESIYDAGAASPFAFQLPTTSTSGPSMESSAIAMLPSPSSNGAGQVEDKYMPPPSTPGTPSLSTPSLPTTKDQAMSVIVFGFPAELTHVVVDHFARFGTIMEHLSSGGLSSTGEHHVGVSDGTPVETGKNWVKITYTTAVAATRALAENGRTLGSMDYVIGCVPHHSPTPLASSSLLLTEGRKTTSSTGGGLLRGSGPSLNIHALLSEGANEDAGSSRRRKGDESWKVSPAAGSSNLFTPVGHPQQQPVAAVPFTPQQPPQQQRQDATKMPPASLPRMKSVPAGLGKRIDVRGPEGIFKEKERKGGSMLSGSATLRGLASILLGTGTTDYSSAAGQQQQQQQQTLKRVAGEDLQAGSGGNGKKPAQQESWLGWTTKKTQEFIFGWDDL